MTSLYITAAILAAFLLLIWHLGRLAEKAGERGARDALNSDALDVLDEANDAANDLDGVSRSERERVLSGTQKDSS